MFASLLCLVFPLPSRIQSFLLQGGLGGGFMGQMLGGASWKRSTDLSIAMGSGLVAASDFAMRRGDRQRLH